MSASNLPVRTGIANLPLHYGKVPNWLSLISISKDTIINLEARETWNFVVACSGAGCGNVKTYEIIATVASSSRGY